MWDLYERLAAQHPSTLTEQQRGLVAVCDLRQEVNAGGFDSYFRGPGGDSAETAAAALPELLGPEWADLLRSAMTLLGSSYPTDAVDRGDVLDELDDDDRLDELDERFFALEEEADADGRLNAYLDARPG